MDHLVFAEYVDPDRPASKQALAALEDFLEHGLGIRDGARDRAENFRRSLLPFERLLGLVEQARVLDRDRKSTRLNSSHLVISYAVFCLKKKKLLCINSLRNQ